MALDGLDDDAVRAILAETRRVAVVGASDRPERPSFGVLAWLVARGYDAIPVNPGLEGQQILGRMVVGSLAACAPLDMVDVFRRSDSAGPVVDEAIRLRARTVWLQLGVIDLAAATRARRAGLTVVMDRCPKIEFHRLGMGNPRFPARERIEAAPAIALNADGFAGTSAASNGDEGSP